MNKAPNKAPISPLKEDPAGLGQAVVKWMIRTGQAGDPKGGGGVASLRGVPIEDGSGVTEFSAKASV